MVSSSPFDFTAYLGALNTVWQFRKMLELVLAMHMWFYCRILFFCEKLCMVASQPFTTPKSIEGDI
jgi:hypothetical protein